MATWEEFEYIKECIKVGEKPVGLTREGVKILNNRLRLKREEEQLNHPEVEKFILAWEVKFGDNRVLESDLWALAERIPDMPDFEGWSRKWGRNLTRLLLRLRGRVYGRVELRLGKNSVGIRIFWLHKLQNS